jgi:predicted metal-dependent peptidase
MYNPEFMGALSDKHKLGVLKHEFYHIIFEHVTGRKPADGLKRIDNIAMDLAINSHIRDELPNESEPGPVIGKEPMKCVYPRRRQVCTPSSRSTRMNGTRRKLEAEKEQSKDDAGDGGGGEPEWSDQDSFDSHDAFGDAEGTAGEIAKERLKDAVKKAAQEAEKARNWGSMSSQCRKRIMDSIVSKVDWRKVMRYFIKTSQRAERMSTPRRLNKRFPKIHPGKRVRRQAKIAISIDQSGSVDDGMLAAFFAELNKLAEIAEFTVIPFDSQVAEDKVYTWKKGQSRAWERVLTGGT